MSRELSVASQNLQAQKLVSTVIGNAAFFSNREGTLEEALTDGLISRSYLYIDMMNTKSDEIVEAVIGWSDCCIDWG